MRNCISLAVGLIYSNLIGSVADGPVGDTTTSTTLPWVIESVCSRCSCQSISMTKGWRGHQSLESCAITCAQEGSWFKHATDGDSNCDCCLNLENVEDDSGWGIRVYQLRDMNWFHYYQQNCEDCSCTSSDQHFPAQRSFRDCVDFCAGQEFLHFQYEAAGDTAGTCACCNSSETVGSSSAAVYTFAESGLNGVQVGSAHPAHVACFLQIMLLLLLW